MPVFSILALIAYSLSLGLIVPSLVQKNSAYRRLALVSAVVALVCHAIALKHQIFDVGGGQNLTLLNIGSIVGLMICTIMTIVASQGRMRRGERAPSSVSATRGVRGRRRRTPSGSG